MHNRHNRTVYNAIYNNIDIRYRRLIIILRLSIYNIIYYCVTGLILLRIYASVPAVVYSKKIDAGTGFITIRLKPAVADIPRDSAPLLCNPCCVWGREKPQKDIFVPRLPYTQPHRTNCPNGSYFLELFGTHRAHFTYVADREEHSIIYRHR